ncbi:MAG TPA: SRPBCC domain-containing protein [Nitrospirota bacterium]|nr:SRPBCC domain-containing protein [Nitrospirota bacterium]
MPKTIEQSVTLPAPAEKLFEMYLSPKKHSEITGGPVSISSKAGSRFRAFDGMILGKTLLVIPKYMIVQSWRGSHWKKEEIDSILILTFLPEGKKGRIELVHANVADSDYEGVKEGWEKYYWKPWHEYLVKLERESKVTGAKAA